MGFCVKLIVLGHLLGAASVGLLFWGVLTDRFPPMPDVPEVPEKWFGPGKRVKESTAIEPFKIKVEDKVLEDLRHRIQLDLTRLAPPLEDSAFNYGFNTNYLKEVGQYWLDKYDWRKEEAALNKFPQFTTQIDGLKVHFIHAKPDPVQAKGKKVIPMLIVHGWPGSVVEFKKIIPMLTTPQEGQDFVFEVIAPSIPGFGYSSASAKMGFNAKHCARIFKHLMERLGHKKFYAQGGDWGSFITTNIGILYPESLLGLHINMVTARNPAHNLMHFLAAWLPSGWVVGKEEEGHILPFAEKFADTLLESGYLHIQATKPDTVGSVVEFQKILPILTTPAAGQDFVFEVIAPSIPGYGFSSAPAKKGFNGRQCGRVFNTLMKRLGHEQYYTQGGDWGSLITTAMAALFPENVIGAHLNMVVANTPASNLLNFLTANLPSGWVINKEDEEMILPFMDRFTDLLLESGYLHIQATKPDTVGSVLEFTDLIPMLTKASPDRDFVFEVVAPSIPGYGFSSAPAKMGFNSRQCARVFLLLMSERLGFERFYTQGGDWGSLITMDLAALYPENVIGTHLNGAFANTPSTYAKWFLASYLPSGWLLTPQEEEMALPYSEKFLHMFALEMGYMHIQATKPDTVGVALSSSPVGLAGYIMEKFSTWTNKEWKSARNGNLTTKYKIDRLLNNVMMYWLSNSITSSARFYKENFQFAQDENDMARIPTRVPVGIAAFKNEILNLPRWFLESKHPNMVSYNFHDDGGHFAAFEVPELLFGDYVQFVQKVEEIERKGSSKGRAEL